jgi:2-keto-3-deoxy-L-rhamnonate aldolase RhmA
MGRLMAAISSHGGERRDDERPHDNRDDPHRPTVRVGTFLNGGSTVTAEICGRAGFDWFAVDLEHGAGDEVDALRAIQALHWFHAHVLVRVESNDRPRIQRALDSGAEGVIVPRVYTLDDARRARDNCHYSRARGVAIYNRSHGWGLSPRVLSDVDQNVICALQVETREAVAIVDEMAALDGVSMLFLGPSDLSNALGISGGAADADLLSVARKIAGAARKAGKTAGVLVGDPILARVYADIGFQWLAVGSDTSMLANCARDVVHATRSALHRSPAVTSL